MPKALTASDRSALIRLASSLPLGSKERRVILAELAKTPAGAKKLYDKYRAEHPATKKGPKDFYEPKAKGDGEKSEKAKSKGEKGQEKTDKRREEKEKDEYAYKHWALDDVKKVIQKGPEAVRDAAHEIMKYLEVDPEEEGVDVALAEAKEQMGTDQKYEFARALLSKHKKNQSKKASSDRKTLIRLASSLPVGSPERKAILGSLSRQAASYKEYLERAKKEGKKPISQDEWEARFGKGKKDEGKKDEGKKDKPKGKVKKEDITLESDAKDLAGSLLGEDYDVVGFLGEDYDEEDGWMGKEIQKFLKENDAEGTQRLLEEVSRETNESHHPLKNAWEEVFDGLLKAGDFWFEPEGDEEDKQFGKRDPASRRAAIVKPADRKALIRLASSLPVGSPERKAILAGLSKTAASLKSVEAELAIQLRLHTGLGPKDQMGLKGRTVWLADGKGEILIYETNDRGVVLNYKGKEYKSVKDLMRSL